MATRDNVLWNAMIVGYVDRGCHCINHIAFIKYYQCVTVDNMLMVGAKFNQIKFPFLKLLFTCNFVNNTLL
jgi:hypothetical protein